MATLTQCANQLRDRPQDECYLDLPSMAAHFDKLTVNSRQLAFETRKLRAVVANDELLVTLGNGNAHLTNWSFNQLATIARAPAGYLANLPANVVAQCLNAGFANTSRDTNLALLQKQDTGIVFRSATSEKYSRIWNRDILKALVNRFGDGRTGDFRIPGEFGKDVAIGKHNTTLFAGDRDMFVFLADEHNRIEIPNRRGGKSGTLARGFFVYNSEVGARSFGVTMFLFDYVCSNRCIWGATNIQEFKSRHVGNLADRWLDEVQPVITAMSNQSSRLITDRVVAAQAARIDGDVDQFLGRFFTKAQVAELKMTHEFEEDRPIETLWDVTTATTAMARDIPWQDKRVELETIGGSFLEMAA